VKAVKSASARRSRLLSPTASLPAFRAILMPLRQTLKAQPFFGGGEPLYADYAVFSPFQWARCISVFQLLGEDDPVKLYWKCHTILPFATSKAIAPRAALSREGPGAERPALTTQFYFPDKKENRTDAFFHHELVMQVAPSDDELRARFKRSRRRSFQVQALKTAALRSRFLVAAQRAEMERHGRTANGSRRADRSRSMRRDRCGSVGIALILHGPALQAEALPESLVFGDEERQDSQSAPRRRQGLPTASG
jgi:hypothetical protein